MQRTFIQPVLAGLLALVVSVARGDFVIDGINNFAPANTYATSTVGYTGYVAASATDLHFAISGNDIQSGGGDHWWVTYLGGNGTGTTTGVNFNTQQPGLSFNATHFVQWSPSGSPASLHSWNGTNWVNTGFSVPLQRTGQFVEASIPLANLGSPSSLQFASYMLYEGAGFESSYAVNPSSAFVDGYDPNVGSFLTIAAVPEPSAFLAVGLVGMLACGGQLRRRRRAEGVS